MVSPFSSPRRSKKGSKENPYSNRGLEKFSALLSELEEKRQSIYAKRIDSDGPPLVRFVFKISGECVPVMIKTKKAGKKKDVQDNYKFKTEEKEGKKTEQETEQKHSCVLNENLKKISRPNHFLPVAVILVLIFLVFLGRSVSIMCTCIVWYLVPIIREQTRNRGSLDETKKKMNIENRASFNQRTGRDHLKEKKFPYMAAPAKSR